MGEIELLVKQARRLKLSEEKTLRTLKAILLRAKTWQNKVMKALSPSPGETKAYNVEALKELETSSEDIPLLLKEEALLSGVIEDTGCRHCVCGGPTDARVMLSCDNCEKWFHGPCVDMTREQCDSIGKWVCPPCTGSPSPVDVSKCGIVWEDRDDPRLAKTRHVASEAPDPQKMWPPFGLFGCDEAREVLGDECSSIPDATTTKLRPELPPAVPSIPTVNVNSKPQTTSTEEVESMIVPPTALVLSADVSQEPDMPLNQGFKPPTCALLRESDDKDAQSEQLAAAAAVARTGLDLSHQQAFQWLAQSSAAAIAATQVNLTQVQPQGLGDSAPYNIEDKSGHSKSLPPQSDLRAGAIPSITIHSPLLSTQYETQQLSFAPSILPLTPLLGFAQSLAHRIYIAREIRLSRRDL